jgi:hypothetical protein
MRPKAADVEPYMLLSGPDRWNKQPTGLVRAAIEAEAHRLRPKDLPLSEAFGGMTTFRSR